MATICPVNDVIVSSYILLPHNLAACWHGCGRIACLGRVSTKNPMQLSSIYLDVRSALTLSTRDLLP